MKTYFLIIIMSVFVISLFTTSVFAQNDSTLKYDPTLQYGLKPQTPAETPEQLHKKLVNARDAITNMMGSKMGNIPFNEVGIDEVNSTLDVGIDSTKATLSEEQYLKKIKEIVGDIPIKITFGEIHTLPLILANNSTRGNDIVTPMLSPLRQFKSGVAANDVICSNGFILITKSEDRTPACVTQKTSYELLSRGWAILVGSTTVSDVTVNGTTYHIPYVLRGHGNKMLEMDANTIKGYLVMHVDSTADKGEITAIIPKALLDPQNHEFVVLVDGVGVKHSEVVTQTTTTLTIPFGFGAKEIEITISKSV